MDSTRCSSAFRGSVGLLFMMLVTWSAAASGAEGTKCEPPSVTVSWESYDLVRIILVSNSDDAEEFCLSLWYMSQAETEKGAGPLLPQVVAPRFADLGACSGAGTAPDDGQLRFRVNATPAGTSVKLHVDRPTLLRSGGFIGFQYRSESASSCGAERRSGPGDSQLKILDKHSLSFDLGTVLGLEGDGSWSNRPEVAASFYSRWRQTLSVGSVFRYSGIAKIAEDPKGEGGDPNEAEEEDQNDPTFDPFQSGGGSLQVQLFAFLSCWKRFGFAFGAGVSTLPGDGTSELKAKPHEFFALRGEVEAYNSGRPTESLAGSSGWIQAGWMRDELFDDVVVVAASDTIPEVRSDESDRAFLEAQLELPRVGTKWFRMLVRAFASVPTSGDGPSDIRVSVLGSVDPTQWFEGARGSGH